MTVISQVTHAPIGPAQQAVANVLLSHVPTQTWVARTTLARTLGRTPKNIDNIVFRMRGIHRLQIQESDRNGERYYRWSAP